MIATNKSLSHVGIGLYSMENAARLTGAHPETIRRWLSESDGIVTRQFGDEKLLTFEELMEIHFIQMFREQGVTFQTIRKASVTASKLFDTRYPFTVQRFNTDGKSLFATLLKEQTDEVMTEDLAKGQYVFETILRPFFKKLDYHGPDEKVVRYWPLEKSGRVVLDPQRKFGKPIDDESGVSTSAIFEAVKAGSGQQPEVVARWLGIPLSAVTAALRFERSLTA